MWGHTIEPLKEGRALAVRFRYAQTPATVAQVIGAWLEDESFRRDWIHLLGSAPFAAYRWETPPVTCTTLDREFECVLVDSPALAGRPPDQASFAEHFRRHPGDRVLSFENLRKDALMVVPRPETDPSSYVHLAAFMREAPEAQKHELWRRVGEAMRERLNDQPIWLSTAGGGVAWLHVRLDERPKYYSHEPYTRFGAGLNSKLS